MDYRDEYERIARQAKEALKSTDLDALLRLDSEVVATLEKFSKKQRSEKEDVMYKVFLEKLGALYQDLQTYLSQHRADASQQLKTISDSRKGIKAYQSNR